MVNPKPYRRKKPYLEDHPYTDYDKEEREYHERCDREHVRGIVNDLKQEHKYYELPEWERNLLDDQSR